MASVRVVQWRRARGRRVYPSHAALPPRLHSPPPRPRLRLPARAAAATEGSHSRPPTHHAPTAGALLPPKTSPWGRVAPSAPRTDPSPKGSRRAQQTQRPLPSHRSAVVRVSPRHVRILRWRVACFRRLRHRRRPSAWTSDAACGRRDAALPTRRRRNCGRRMWGDPC